MGKGQQWGFSRASQLANRYQAVRPLSVRRNELSGCEDGAEVRSELNEVEVRSES